MVALHYYSNSFWNFKVSSDIMCHFDQFSDIPVAYWQTPIEIQLGKHFFYFIFSKALKMEVNNMHMNKT